MAVSRRIFVLTAAVVAAATAVVVVLGRDMFGNTTTDLKLEMSGNACTITTPINDKDVTVKKNKKITWTVRNACTTDQFVSVGNVRRQAEDPAKVPDCKAGMAESYWPFKAQDQARRSVFVPKDGGVEDIVLKEAKNDTGKPDVYYFDVCTGGAKKDPRLVVDPF